MDLGALRVRKMIKLSLDYHKFMEFDHMAPIARVFSSVTRLELYHANSLAPKLPLHVNNHHKGRSTWSELYHMFIAPALLRSSFYGLAFSC